MKLGSDFWLIIKIVQAVIMALIAVLGDEDDRKNAKQNGF